jgi:hypothetical protein
MRLDPRSGRATLQQRDRGQTRPVQQAGQGQRRQQGARRNQVRGAKRIHQIDQRRSVEWPVQHQRRAAHERGNRSRDQPGETGGRKRGKNGRTGKNARPCDEIERSGAKRALAVDARRAVIVEGDDFALAQAWQAVERRAILRDLVQRRDAVGLGAKPGQYAHGLGLETGLQQSCKRMGAHLWLGAKRDGANRLRCLGKRVRVAAIRQKGGVETGAQRAKQGDQRRNPRAGYDQHPLAFLHAQRLPGGGGAAHEGVKIGEGKGGGGIEGAVAEGDALRAHAGAA